MKFAACYDVTFKEVCEIYFFTADDLDSAIAYIKSLDWTFACFRGDPIVHICNEHGLILARVTV